MLTASHRCLFTAFSSLFKRQFSTGICSVPVLIEKPVKYYIEDLVNEPPYPRNPRMTRMLKKIHLEGPLGKLFVEIPEGIEVEELPSRDPNYQELQVMINQVLHDSKPRRQRDFISSMSGTVASLIRQYAVGVLHGYSVPLSFVGIGFRCALSDPRTVELRIGYCHPVYYKIPDGLTVHVPFPTRMIIYGPSYQQVRLFAAELRNLKKPEPYKGKGIYLADESKRLKPKKKI